MSDFQIEWIDLGREPQSASNPAYPNGIELDLTSGRKPTCKAELPYPAPCCGLFQVKCKTCGYTVMVTAAGRPDDPKSIKLACVGEKRE